MAAVLIVLELTNDYALVVPVMLAVATATALSRVIAPKSLEEDQLEHEGYRPVAERRDPLAGLLVRDVMSTAPIALQPQMTRAATGEQRHRFYPVVDPTGGLVGLVEGRRLRDEHVTAAELMEPPRLVATEEELVHDLLRRTRVAGTDRCPVVSAEGLLVGFISPSDLVRARFRATEDEALR